MNSLKQLSLLLTGLLVGALFGKNTIIFIFPVFILLMMTWDEAKYQKFIQKEETSEDHHMMSHS
ncbi:hypothetical protein [Vagococcus humatus]|uniref:DUF2273 domain-containing protein n=1 Tax=Vagococcus humatus TaxID=1889241 RepID=A0A429Z7C5_9ENTE|nr:hypothetical protein [Vagococcus humatus]RST89630.1 hypothetical protein C7P63_00700 [Vagococcus humatus]